MDKDKGSIGLHHVLICFHWQYLLVTYEKEKSTGSSICLGMDRNKDWFSFRSSNSSIHASIEHPASGFGLGPLLYACDFFHAAQDPAIFSLAIRSNGSFVAHQGLVIS
jgi:hypothetical protein